MRRLLLLLVFPLTALSQNNLPALGSWREHLPYNSAIAVTASDKKIYAATPYSLFSIDRSNREIERFSKVWGLSETGISTIAYDAASQKLYIAYSNSNLDVVDNGGLRNLAALKRAAIAGDKTIYALYPDGDRCYIATGLGVLVMDVPRNEIRESWLIGAAGGYVKTTGFVKAAGFFYAATDEGLKRTAVTNPTPSNHLSWQTVSGTAGLPAGAAKGVASLQNKVVVWQNDSLFAETGNGWRLFFANGWPVVSMTASGNELVVTQRQSNGASQVVALNENGAVVRTLQQPTVISFPQQAIKVEGDYWVADRFGGLSQFTAGGFEVYRPDSPPDLVYGEMTVRDGVLWVTAGSVNSNWNYQFNRSGVFRLKNGEWTATNPFNTPSLDSLLDFISIAIDPRDNSAWAGSFGGGLLHLRPDARTIYKQNSPLLPTIGDPGSYRVAGLAFDADNNLWVANFGSPRQLHVRRADGSWQSFTAPFTLRDNAVAQIVVDDAGQKWIQSPMSNGLLVFSDGNPAITADDRWKLYRAGQGLGGLPANDVTCLAKDKTGFIWVGTTNGIAVIQCPQDAFTNTGCDAVLPVIKDGSFASFLFKGQEVRSIAVDGADRKWVATADGLWLVSRDGDKVLANFTEQNSPLLSNDVRRIAVDGQSGEVFIATAKGLLSYRGGATEAAEASGKVLVFPNPVPPGYSGNIGIRGVPENVVVMIIEPNGRLVFQTRSLGGQALWNGRDYKGRKAASGVYLVMAANETGTEKPVARIVVVQ